MSNIVSIPLTGVPASDPVPGIYTEIDFAQGPASGANVVYGALLMGNKTSAGDATVDTVVYGGPTSALPLQTESDAISRFGQGSELHRMWRRWVKKNPTTPVYAIAITESAGTAATKVITFATTATGNGNVRCTVDDDFVDVAIATGDTPTVIATAVKNAILARPDWAVTAGNASGVLTITAKNKGPRGNWHSARAVITGSGVGTTSDTTAQAFFTTGATADSNTVALTTIAATRYYYLVPAAVDQTQLVALSTQVSTQAIANPGIRQTIFASNADTEGNGQTIAIALNQARAEIIWMANSARHVVDLVADVGSIYALGETPDGLGAPSLHNFNGLGTGNRAIDALWDVPPAFDGSTPSHATQVAALQNGLSPIAKNMYGQTYLVMRVTTRTLTGGVSDYRIRPPHKVRILDWWADSNATILGQRYAGFDIIDDPLPNQVYTSNKLVWPSKIRDDINANARRWADDGQFQSIDTMTANTIAIRELTPRTRLSAQVPATPIDTFDQLTLQYLQVA